MGHNDHLPDLREAAEGIAEEAGAIYLCEDCGEEYVNRGDPDLERKAYALGTIQIQKGEIIADREKLMAEIKSVLDDTPEHCPECDRREHRDD